MLVDKLNFFRKIPLKGHQEIWLDNSLVLDDDVVPDPEKFLDPLVLTSVLNTTTHYIARTVWSLCIR